MPAVHVGIDYLTVNYPLRDSEALGFAWDYSGVPVDPRPWKGWGRITGNPATAISPNEGRLVSLAEVLPHLRRAWDASCGVASAGVELNDAVVSRIDLAVDFDAVEGASEYLVALKNQHRPYGGNPRIYYDKVSGVALTLDVPGGNQGKPGRVKLYNKSVQRGEISSAPTLRWEATCRRWASTVGGIERIEHLNQERVEALARNRWEWSGMGAEIVGAVTLAHLLAQSRLSPTKQLRLAGELLMRAAGHSVTCSNDRSASTRRAARELFGHDTVLDPTAARSC